MSKSISDKLWDHFCAELSVYRNIEHWGLTLILGGIGATTYKLVEWTSKSEPLRDASQAIVFGPLVVGISGMIFLRMVNFRSAGTWIRLRKMISESTSRRWWLGRIIAWLPLGAGAGGTTLVKCSRCATNCSNLVFLLTLIGVVVLSAFLTEVFYCCMTNQEKPEVNVKKNQNTV